MLPERARPCPLFFQQFFLLSLIDCPLLNILSVAVTYEESETRAGLDGQTGGQDRLKHVTGEVTFFCIFRC